MLSENKLEKRTLGGNTLDNQVTDDPQNSQQDGAVYNLIQAGLVGATFLGLFKSGALKPIAKPLMELADKVAKEGTDKAGVAMTTLKEWSNLKNLSEAQFNVSRQKYNAPDSPSIFRDRDSSLFRDLMKDAKESIESGRPDFYNVKKLMQGSVDDINLLNHMIKDKEGNIKNIQSNYLNTELNFRLDEMTDFEKTTARYHPNQQMQFNQKAIEAFMTLILQDSKKAKQELVEMGYRKMTLGDIAELKVENNIRSLVLKPDSPIDLGSRANEKYESLLEKVNTFFDNSNGYHRYQKNGKGTNVWQSGDWANIIVDPNIRIDKKGNVVDYRMSYDNLIEFAHSLANDFKLPVVQFNPFKTIFGLDKIGRKQPLMGLINNQQFDPNITRTGGRESIQNWMVKSFGDEYENKGIAIIKGKAYTTDENGALKELGSGYKLHDITHSGTGYNLKPMLNATRQMSGLSLGQIDKEITKEYMAYYKKETGKDLSSFKKAKYELGKLLDIGYQERKIPGKDEIESLDTATSFDEVTNKFVYWLTDRPLFKTNGFEYKDTAELLDSINVYNHKTVFGEGFETFKDRHNQKFTPKMFTTTKEGFKLKNAFNKWNNYDNEGAVRELEGFRKQFFVGRNADNTMHEFFTERSGMTWDVLNKLSEGIGNSSSLLGLSIDSKRSSVDLFKNLLLKRALPVFLATKIPDVFNYYSEPFFSGSEDGENKDNITKFISRNIVKPLDIKAHQAMDFLGATRLFKFLGEMTPGYDQINELPGVYQLGIGQTGEEREDYIEHGYDPIRKGRWWASGNTPLTGGKIMYWRPNKYRRTQADVDFSDSKWGSRQEYFNNTWFPNPVNPLAPLNYFVLDRNHYDKKHYHDRPYLQTAPVGQNIPLIGPLFGATVGQVIGPQQKMHLGYWQKGFAVEPRDENKNILLTEGTLDIDTVIKNHTPAFNNAMADTAVYNNMQAAVAQKFIEYSQKLSASAYQAKEVISRGFMEKAGITFQQTRILPTQSVGGMTTKSFDFMSLFETPFIPQPGQSNTDKNSYGTIKSNYKEPDYDKDPSKTQYEAYSTPSGQLNIVDVPDNLNLYDVNQGIKEYSISKVIGTKQRVTIDNLNGPGIPVGNDSKEIDNAFLYGLGEQYNWLGDIAGLKGFAFQQFVTGHPNENARIIEDSNYAYSANKDFWEENLGGLGGNLSEIARRFMPKRNNKTDYVNPIRNTMPSWMPGSSYFTDFKHGDPYCLSKDTLVLTDKGYIKAENTKIGDIILTNKGNHYPIKNIAIRPIEANEKSYKLTISGIDKKIPLEFSENHPILTKHLFRGQPCGGKCKPYIKSYKHDCDTCKSNKWDKSQIEYVKAKEIQIGDAVVFPIPVIDNPITTLDYQYEWQNAPRSPKYIKKGSLAITKNIAWLIGLFLAEGSTAKCRGKIHRLLFAFHSSETEVADKVCDILENTFGKRPYVIFRKEHDSLEVILCDAQIARIFDSIVSRNLYEKRIPKEFYYSTKENMTELLLGFMLGDGTVQRNYMIGTTANQQLAYDLHRLSMYAGIPCQIIERNTRKSYEVCIHSFNLKNLDLSGLMHKQNKLNFNYTRTPGLLSYSDGTYIYSEIINKQEIILDYVYGFEVDIDDSFCVIGFATHNSKIDNGEERLPGEGYERLNNIKGLMEFNIGSSSIGYSKEKIVKHMLKQDEEKTSFEEDTLDKGTDIHAQIEQAWLDAGMAINTEQKVEDKRNGIIGYYDALVHDRTSKTGVAITDIKTTSAKRLEEIRKARQPLDEHKRQVNYYLWATGNTESKGYIYYVDKENLNNNYTVGFKYDDALLRDTLKNVYEARQEIRGAVQKGIIGRGELYDKMDKFRILADVAPYSQEFKDVAATLNPENMTASEEREARVIRERIKKQKEPLRVYPYKFKTSNLKSETVTVSEIIDNNTIVTKEYGKEHSIKFAGIHVSEANSEMYDKKRTMSEAARDKINRYLKPGRRIEIQYDADAKNKFSKDSTESIRAVVMTRGKNLNKVLLSEGHAKEKEDDDSPAAIQARYTKGEIAFGSAMETLTHDVVGNIPFIGSKFMQVRSPYEQYRKREVYSKDFQSWNHPIRDILMPYIDETIANNTLGGFGGIVTGAFIGSIFGRKKGFGKLIGAIIGGTIPAVGKIAYAAGSDKERDWRPKRRIEQEKLNEYVDVLKFIKNARLYEQYKLKAKKEDNFDVEAFVNSKEAQGVTNKLRKQELADFKKNVKLDFRNKDKYNFKYGKPKYYESKMTKEQAIKAINQEMAEIQGDREVTKIPDNALKAIKYRQATKQTMYGYEPGDSLVNIMTALPKKDRQYFKHFMDAPEEEKDKILRIAPSYMRRALQSVWGRPVDKKPSLEEYFQNHALPDQKWIGWEDTTDMDDVKVKLIHQNNLDPGEFDVWDDNKEKADQTNIPIPLINAKNNARQVQVKLNSLLTSAGYNDVQTTFLDSKNNNKTKLIINRDARNDVERQINSMEL